MYELQLSLRSLSYFDLYGRLRITCELARVMVEVPLILDKAMKTEPAPSPSSSSSSASSSSSSQRCPADGRTSDSSADRPRGEQNGSPGATTMDGSGSRGGSFDDDESTLTNQLERRGILGVRTRGMLVLTCRMLEKAERWSGGGGTQPGTRTGTGTTGRSGFGSGSETGDYAMQGDVGTESGERDAPGRA
ncbi:hypothetical protein JCM10212_003573 [Sporobolomyces blumeae]